MPTRRACFGGPRRAAAALRLAILVCCAGPALAPASARAEDDGTFWVGYMSTWRLEQDWALWFDTHYNHDAFYVARGGVTRVFEAGPRLTAGYAFLLVNPSLERHEHRPWAQLFVPLGVSDAWSLSGRLRLDFRFLESLDGGSVTSGTDFVFRTRWQTVLTRRFAPTRFGRPMVQLANEVLVNAAADPGRDVLDQNRVSLLFGLETEHATVRVGYMNRYLPGSGGASSVYEHGAILWLNHTIDLTGRRRRLPRPEHAHPEEGGP